MENYYGDGWREINTRGMQIKELHLFTDDLDATSAFYTNLLELTVLDEDGESVALQAGKTKLVFAASHHHQPFYHFAFNIPCNQIDDAHRWAKEKFPILDIEPGEKIADFSSWHARAFYFLDNNGNILEFISRFDLRNESSNRFKGSSIVSVSEIGIVTDDVRATCQEMAQHYDLHFFDKQTPLENFAAVGDDKGLFIVVSEHRNWYPTQIPSKKSKGKVIFISNVEANKSFLLKLG